MSGCQAKAAAATSISLEQQAKFLAAPNTRSISLFIIKTGTFGLRSLYAWHAHATATMQRVDLV